MVNKKGRNYPIRSNLYEYKSVGSKEGKRQLPKNIHRAIEYIFGQLDGQKEMQIFLRVINEGDFHTLGLRLNGRKKVPLWVFPMLRANAKRVARGKEPTPILMVKKRKAKSAAKADVGQAENSLYWSGGGRGMPSFLL